MSGWPAIGFSWSIASKRLLERDPLSQYPQKRLKQRPKNRGSVTDLEFPHSHLQWNPSISLGLDSLCHTSSHVSGGGMVCSLPRVMTNYWWPSACFVTIELTSPGQWQWSMSSLTFVEPNVHSWNLVSQSLSKRQRQSGNLPKPECWVIARSFETTCNLESQRNSPNISCY